jgi:Antirestriction protein
VASIEQAPSISASSDVPDERRSAFLPRFLGRYFLKGEGMIFEWAHRLSVDYDGGVWRFIELSNGGFYVAPARERNLRVEWHLNGFDGMLGADAFGVVVTLFALCHMTELSGDDGLIER